MSDVVKMAALLGRVYVPHCHSEEDPLACFPGVLFWFSEESLALDLAKFAQTLERDCCCLQSVWRLFQERGVWQDPVLAAFFVQKPLENGILVRLSSPSSFDTPGVFEFLLECLDHGADVSRVACATLPPLTKAVQDTPYVLELCSLLYAVACCPEARGMLADPRLWSHLAARMSARTLLVPVVRILLTASCLLLDHPDVVFPVVDRCALSLVSSTTQTETETQDAALSLLEACLAVNAATWRPRLVSRTVQMARTGWPEALGPFLALMLDGTSVQLLLALERSSVLDPLYAAAVRHVRAAESGDILTHATTCCHDWLSVRTYLRRAWPERFETSQQKKQKKKQKPSSSSSVVVTCPITLDVCLHPVVASDGHTYERDALLRYMATTTMLLSPVTKQPLEYHLYDNRAVM